MEINFKFEIGQIVYHRLHGPVERDADVQVRTPLLIIERIAAECSGGFQLSYRVRIGVSKNTLTHLTVSDPTNLHAMLEIELES